jgi:hypothetical protein
MCCGYGGLISTSIDRRESSYTELIVPIERRMILEWREKNSGEE